MIRQQLAQLLMQMPYKRTDSHNTDLKNVNQSYIPAVLKLFCSRRPLKTYQYLRRLNEAKVRKF